MLCQVYTNKTCCLEILTSVWVFFVICIIFGFFFNTWRNFCSVKYCDLETPTEVFHWILFLFSSIGCKPLRMKTSVRINHLVQFPRSNAVKTMEDYDSLSSGFRTTRTRHFVPLLTCPQYHVAFQPKSTPKATRPQTHVALKSNNSSPKVQSTCRATDMRDAHCWSCQCTSATSPQRFRPTLKISCIFRHEA